MLYFRSIAFVHLLGEHGLLVFRAVWMYVYGAKVAAVCERVQHAISSPAYNAFHPSTVKNDNQTRTPPSNVPFSKIIIQGL